MKIIECPRDAMQGLDKFIPTDDKVRYLGQLMSVGFDSLDAGSFVSPKAIPQMSDTGEVLRRLEGINGLSKILVIVANLRGAQQACAYPSVHYLGFPLSLSETFQQRNTNKSIPDALNVLNEIQELCQRSGKTLVTYLSMGFGNPYNDPYDIGIVEKFADILATLDIKIISLADTIGVSTPLQLSYLFKSLTAKFPAIEFGAHLHSNPYTAIEKIEAAFTAGCKRFDGALKGFGGCPMAEDKLVGNLATETLISFLDSKGSHLNLDRGELNKAISIAEEIFPPN